jgi:hypothetical protein
MIQIRKPAKDCYHQAHIRPAKGVHPMSAGTLVDERTHTCMRRPIICRKVAAWTGSDCSGCDDKLLVALQKT